MNLEVIKLLVENPRSRLVYVEGRATREHILKRLFPYLIKSYLWFHVLKLVSQRNLPHQRILVKVQKFLRDNSRNKLYLCNMKIMKIPALFQIPSQSNNSLKGKKSSVHSFLPVFSKVTVLMHGNLLRATAQMEALRLKVLVLSIIHSSGIC